MTTLQLELYVTGQSMRSQAAITNLQRILVTRRLAGRYQLVIVDVLEQPDAAEAANVVATPTLIRRSPAPVRRLIGDLSPVDAVLFGLGIEDDLAVAGEESGHE